MKKTAAGEVWDRLSSRPLLPAAAAAVLALLLYLIAWPVPVDPVAWQAPDNPGYTGPYAANPALANLSVLPLGGRHGPEDIALGDDGRLYAATREGVIVRLRADGAGPEDWADTGGRPLGIDFDADGNLIVADAYRGLLSIAPDGTVRELATFADGIPIRYADDVDVAADGRIYFSDASTRFGALAWSGTYEASLLDILEHGGHGRLLVYEPANGTARALLSGIDFANGVAVSPDQRFVLVNETGSYRVIRYWLTGSRAGEHDYLIEELPGFPDNVSAGLNGRYWIALVSPRSALLDRLSGSPGLRKLVQRLPGFLRPAAQAYGHIIAVDADGKVVANLQDPDGGFPIITSVVETPDHLYLGSLVATGVGRLDKRGLR